MSGKTQTRLLEEKASNVWASGACGRVCQHAQAARTPLANFFNTPFPREVGIPAYLFFSRMLPLKLRHKDVAHGQEFGCSKIEGKKRVSSKISGSQKQNQFANLCDDLFIVFVMKDVEDEVRE
ncbi:hypothetical protein PJI16_07415 [Nitrospira sp. MA-1]|nr:hypothetical protein [Nitrospira sp. MA-1]